MKISIAIGKANGGELKLLALSENADTVVKAYNAALNGADDSLESVALFVRPDFVRRGKVEHKPKAEKPEGKKFK